MKSGIYLFETDRGAVYVGSATDLRIRRRSHFATLKAGTHANRVFQRAWNKHGAQAFRFRILLVCRREDLLFYEQRALDVLSPRYNLCKTAGSTQGYQHSEDAKRKMRGRIRSKDHAAKLGIVHVGNSYRLGKTHSQETRLAIGRKLRGRPLSEETRAKMSAAWYPRGRAKRRV